MKYEVINNKYIYIYICVCVCVCVYVISKRCTETRWHWNIYSNCQSRTVSGTEFKILIDLVIPKFVFKNQAWNSTPTYRNPSTTVTLLGLRKKQCPKFIIESKIKEENSTYI